MQDLLRPPPSSKWPTQDAIRRGEGVSGQDGHAFKQPTIRLIRKRLYVVDNYQSIDKCQGATRRLAEFAIDARLTLAGRHGN
jgi:hypothetical protein